MNISINKHLVPLITLVSLNLVIIGASYYGYNQLSSKQNQLAQLKAKSYIIQEASEGSSNSQKLLQKTDQDIKDVSAKYASKDDITPILYIENLANTYNIKQTTSIADSSGLQAIKRPMDNSKKGLPAEAMGDSLTFNIVVIGSYTNIVKFLYSLDNSIYFGYVKNVTFQKAALDQKNPTTDVNGSLTFKISTLPSL